jgi:hypothetical protein
VLMREDLEALEIKTSTTFNLAMTTSTTSTTTCRQAKFPPRRRACLKGLEDEDLCGPQRQRLMQALEMKTYAPRMHWKRRPKR